MKFPYKKFPADPIPPFPERRSILRPVIPIYLIHQDRRIGYEVLIDSGADYCIFHAEIGELIGLDIKKGEKLKFFGTAGDNHQEAYFHRIIIEIGGWEYKCLCGFSYNIKHLPHGLLGQNGFFNLFQVKLNLLKEIIEIMPHKNS